MPISHLPRYLSLLLLIFPLAPQAAESTGLHYDQVNLSVRAGGRVETDTVVAIVYMERQSPQQTTAVNEVNTALRWAAEKATAAGVEAAPQRYRTWPVYNKQNIVGWRVRQSLRIESADPTRIGNLLGELQEKLSIESLRHELTPGARLQAEESFVTEALNAFERRAQLIAQNLKRPGYRIVKLTITTDSTPQPIARATLAASSARAPAPVVDGGRQKVGVRISGTVELDRQP